MYLYIFFFELLLCLVLILLSDKSGGDFMLKSNGNETLERGGLGSLIVLPKMTVVQYYEIICIK